MWRKNNILFNCGEAAAGGKHKEVDDRKWLEDHGAILSVVTDLFTCDFRYVSHLMETFVNLCIFNYVFIYISVILTVFFTHLGWKHR